MLSIFHVNGNKCTEKEERRCQGGQAHKQEGDELSRCPGKCVFTLRTGGGGGGGAGNLCAKETHCPCNGSQGVPAHQTPDLARPMG